MRRNNDSFRLRLEELFKIGAPDWKAGFELALDMGECLVEPLRSKIEKEKNSKRRLLWVAAYGLAARSPQDFLFVRAPRRGLRHARERVMGAFTLAIGPEQRHGAKQLARLLQQQHGARVEAVELVVTCLALARFADREGGARATVPHRLLSSTDPGVLAAALYASPRRTPAQVRAQIRGLKGKDARHQNLVWRGYYLGPASTTSERKMMPKRWNGALKALAQLSSGHRQEAAWALSMRQPQIELPEAVVKNLDARSTLLLAAAPELRKQLIQGGQIRAEPSPTVDLDVRRRLLVCFIAGAPMAKLQSAVAAWSKPGAGSKQGAAMMNEICLALAWRLSVRPNERAQWAGKLNPLGREGTDNLTNAGIWLRLALGEDLKADDPRVRFGELPRPLQLAIGGAMSSRVRAAAIERELWRSKAHPGRAGLELHRRLLFDLLLAHANDNEAYAPPGMLDASSSSFFPIASRLDRFIRNREPWGLEEHHLRW